MEKATVSASAVSEILVQCLTHCHWVLSLYQVPPFTESPASGNGDGGYVCFACGKSTKPGEPFVCVSRLWQIKPRGASLTAVLNAVASLQVCIPCAYQAARHKLTWIHRPELTELEHDGFYLYARLLSQALSRQISGTLVQEPFVADMITKKDRLIQSVEFQDIAGGRFKGTRIKMVDQNSCVCCNKAVNQNQPHMLIQIEVSIPKTGCIDPQNMFKPGKYCTECSRGLFGINDKGATAHDCGPW